MSHGAEVQEVAEEMAGKVLGFSRGLERRRSSQVLPKDRMKPPVRTGTQVPVLDAESLEQRPGRAQEAAI